MSANYNLFYFFKQFPDEEACRKYLEKQRLGDTPVCPHCGNTQKIYRYKNGKTFKCAHCKKQFSVKTGSIYENSNIPLQKWLLTSYLKDISKKEISSIELSKAIGVTQKTAWYLLHKIRYMLKHRNSNNQLRGIVEVDETYVGGKRVNVGVVLKIKLLYLEPYSVVGVYPSPLYPIRNVKHWSQLSTNKSRVVLML